MNDIKNAIKKNKKVEDKWNVIIVISNASSFESRLTLTNDFIKRIHNHEPKVNLYVVELAYGNQKLTISDEKNSVIAVSCCHNSRSTKIDRFDIWKSVLRHTKF